MLLHRKRRDKQDGFAAIRLSNLASALDRDGKHAAALAIYRRAHAADPRDVRVRVNLASALERTSLIEDAEAMLDARMESDPMACVTHAFIALHRGDMDRALAMYAKAARLGAPADQGAFGVALTTLLSGDWTAGWPLYAASVGSANYGPAPRWDGSRVQRLLVHADQGQGDIINFARYVSWAAKQVNQLIFCVPGNMLWLLRHYGTCAKIVTGNPADVEADAQIGLSCLPGIHGTTPDTVPRNTVALQTDYVELGPTKRKRVGICWAGNAGFARDRWRSMPIETLLPLAADPGIELCSFQTGDRAADIVAAGAQSIVRDLSGLVGHEWSFCAGALKQMDAVVTVDTAVAHLAATLGVLTYLCIPKLGDWRWLLGRADSPWYPSMRIERQAAQGDWSGVVERVAAQL